MIPGLLSSRRPQVNRDASGPEADAQNDSFYFLLPQCLLVFGLKPAWQLVIYGEVHAREKELGRV